MKFRKKKKEVSLPDPVHLRWPSGSPIICGADKVYAVAAALTVALRVLEDWKKHSPAQARQLSPVSDCWCCMAGELEPFVEQVERLNGFESE